MCTPGTLNPTTCGKGQRGPNINELYVAGCLTSRCNYGIYKEIDTNICNVYSTIGTILSFPNYTNVRKAVLPPVEDWVNRPRYNQEGSLCKPPGKDTFTKKFCPTSRTKWIWECYAIQIMELMNNADNTQPECTKMPYVKRYAISGNDGITELRLEKNKFCGVNYCKDHSAGKPAPSRALFNNFTPNQWTYNEASNGMRGIVPPKVSSSNKYIITTDDYGIGILAFDDVLYYGLYWFADPETGGTGTPGVDRCVLDKGVKPYLGEWGFVFKLFFRPRKVHTPDLNLMLYKMIQSNKCGKETDDLIPIAPEDNCNYEGTLTGELVPCGYIKRKGDSDNCSKNRTQGSDTKEEEEESLAKRIKLMSAKILAQNKFDLNSQILKDKIMPVLPSISEDVIMEEGFDEVDMWPKSTDNRLTVCEMREKVFNKDKIPISGSCEEKESEIKELKARLQAYEEEKENGSQKDK